MKLPRSRGSQLYLLTLVGVAVGLGLVAIEQWRTGLTVVGATFVVSAIGRAAMPEDHLGMLQVRGKVFDVVWTTLLGVGLVALAVVVPPGPA